MRRQVLALVTMPESGWLTSCAIDAVRAPRLVTRATCASSDASLVERLFRESALGHVLTRPDVLRSASLEVDIGPGTADTRFVIRQPQPNFAFGRCAGGAQD